MPGSQRRGRTLLATIGLAMIITSLGFVAGVELPLGLLFEFGAGLVALETAAVLTRRRHFRRRLFHVARS